MDLSGVISHLSQKGGVGKSTTARTVAVEFARADWNVLIADMDIQQSTCMQWNARRMQNKIEPSVSIQQFHTLDRVIKVQSNYDLIVFDGQPHATTQTLQIAKISDLVVLPSGSSIDDLEPQIKLAHELIKSGISRSKIVFVLSRMGSSQAEIQNAIDYITVGGYTILNGCLRQMDAYKQALDAGYALTETKAGKLGKEAEIVTQSVVDHFEKCRAVA